MDYRKHIIVDPEIMAGKPIIAGTRIPVDIVLEKLAQEIDLTAILHDYPRLTKQDVQAVLHYALEAITSEEVYPTP